MGCLTIKDGEDIGGYALKFGGSAWTLLTSAALRCSSCGADFDGGSTGDEAALLTGSS